MIARLTRIVLEFQALPSVGALGTSTGVAELDGSLSLLCQHSSYRSSQVKCQAGQVSPAQAVLDTANLGCEKFLGP